MVPHLTVRLFPSFSLQQKLMLSTETTCRKGLLPPCLLCFLPTSPSPPLTASHAAYQIPLRNHISRPWYSYNGGYHLNNHDGCLAMGNAQAVDSRAALGRPRRISLCISVGCQESQDPNHEKLFISSWQIQLFGDKNPTSIPVPV